MVGTRRLPGSRSWPAAVLSSTLPRRSGRRPSVPGRRGPPLEPV